MTDRPTDPHPLILDSKTNLYRKITDTDVRRLMFIAGYYSAIKVAVEEVTNRIERLERILEDPYYGGDRPSKEKEELPS